MNINQIALDNLEILNNYDENQYLIPEGNKLSLINKDELDLLSRVELLEYPIYLTFNHILNNLVDNYDLNYRQKKFLLERIDNGIDKLINVIDNYEETYEEDFEESFEGLINISKEINDRYEIISKKILYKRCENLLFIFDDIVDGCRELGKYLYNKHYMINRDIENFYFTSESDSESNSDSDSDSDSESDSESCDENSTREKLE